MKIGGMAKMGVDRCRAFPRGVFQGTYSASYSPSPPDLTQAVGVVEPSILAISYWEAALSAKSMRGSISLQQLADEQPVSVAPGWEIGLGCGRRLLTPPNVTATSLTPWKNDPCDANSPKPPAVSGLPAFWR